MGFPGALPHVPFLGRGIVLKLIDQLFIVVNLFLQGSVLIFELADGLALVLKRRYALRTPQHDGGVGGQRDQPAEKYNRSKNGAVQSRVEAFTFLYNLVLEKRLAFRDDFISRSDKASAFIHHPAFIYDQLCPTPFC
jgi:hypothetical protein